MIIQGNTLSLLKFTAQDFEAYYLLNNNIQVMQFITGKALSEAEARQRFAKNLLVNKENPNLGFFGVKKTSSGEFMGLAKLTRYSPDEIEIGYSLLPEYWGKGFASEIVKCLINYTSTIDINGILMAIVHPDNHASKKVLEKNGFTYSKFEMIDNRPGEIYQLSKN